jgi:hypothetical protein
MSGRISPNPFAPDITMKDLETIYRNKDLLAQIKDAESIYLESKNINPKDVKNIELVGGMFRVSLNNYKDTETGGNFKIVAIDLNQFASALTKSEQHDLLEKVKETREKTEEKIKHTEEDRKKFIRQEILPIINKTTELCTQEIRKSSSMSFKKALSVIKSTMDQLEFDDNIKTKHDLYKAAKSCFENIYHQYSKVEKNKLSTEELRTIRVIAKEAGFMIEPTAGAHRDAKKEEGYLTKKTHDLPKQEGQAYSEYPKLNEQKWTPAKPKR